MPVLDTSASNIGTGTPASVSATPSAIPEVAILATVNEANNTPTNAVNAPSDGTWTLLFSGLAYEKVINALGAITPSQTITGTGLDANQHWVSFLALFSNNGSAPAFQTGSVGNQVNPGPGNSLNIGAAFTPNAGTVLLACLSIKQTAFGFGTHPETFSISDSAGNTWVIVGQPANPASGQGGFSQVFFAYAVNPKLQSTQVVLTQDAADNNGAGLNAIAGFVGSISNVIVPPSLRLLASTGAGI